MGRILTPLAEGGPALPPLLPELPLLADATSPADGQAVAETDAGGMVAAAEAALLSAAQAALGPARAELHAHQSSAATQRAAQRHTLFARCCGARSAGSARAIALQADLQDRVQRLESIVAEGVHQRHFIEAAAAARLFGGPAAPPAGPELTVHEAEQALARAVAARADAELAAADAAERRQRLGLPVAATHAACAAVEEERAAKGTQPAVVVPGNRFAGAHTNNPQYFTYDRGTLRLESVCWLGVAATARAVQPGRYAALLDLDSNETWGRALATRVTSPGVEHCKFAFGPRAQGQGRGTLCVGAVDLETTADVTVHQQLTDGGWKGGLTWRAFRLEPIPGYPGFPAGADTRARAEHDSLRAASLHSRGHVLGWNRVR
jgi:hypothetical protein